MNKISNLFENREEAQRYHRYRPIYHHLLAHELLNYFGHPVSKTLDVACGTGHSTHALRKMSESIIGCDLSEDMLNEARKESSIEFIQAPAENLPFPAAQFDYLNISMAYHWLDQMKFLNEARRVLKVDGVLGIDNYGFTGTMVGRDDFKEKYKAFDSTFMQAAPRNKNYPDEEDLSKSGLELVHEISYHHEVPMNQSDFTIYLMTRSNFLQLTFEQRNIVESKLNSYYKDLFNGETQVLLFHGQVKLYRRRSDYK